MRGAGYWMLKFAFDHDVGFQEGEDEPQDLTVPNAASNPIHQHVMIDGVEGSGHTLPIAMMFQLQ